MRKAGALMPVASLPSRYGIGDFGPEAYQFVDILHAMKLKIWQVLPLNPLGFGNSPYQAYSSFAGDELFISIDFLVRDGLLTQEQVSGYSQLVTKVDYQRVRVHKQTMLGRAFVNFRQQTKWHSEYRQFCVSQPWLHNYAVFLTFKQVNNLQPWTLWPPQFKSWIKTPFLDLTPYQDKIEYVKFLQFMFYRQWFELKAYANQHDIEVMGDIPIYLGLDSLDVWENQDMFLLDATQHPTYIAGVPPDFFSETGQRWGNPLYDWEALAADGFKFWLERLRGNTHTFDIIRIDHFRAFDTYWKIPSSCPTAIEGEWIEAPGYALFDTIYRELPGIKIVAEDLGDLRPEVYDLRDHYHLKGMKIFQFIFDPADNNTELETAVNTIIYTGTHDNSTLIGWYQALSFAKQQQLLAYFKVKDENALKESIINYILQAQAEYVIFPLQDLLGLAEFARINTPGQIGSPNWEWKLTDFSQLNALIPVMAQAVNHAQR